LQSDAAPPCPEGAETAPTQGVALGWFVSAPSGREAIGFRSITALLAFLVVSCWLGGGLPVRAADQAAPTYEEAIRPIFARRCTVCHSAKNQRDLDLSGGLALDTWEAALAGAARHKVIVPGRSAESELVRRLSDPDEERRMPLQDAPLPDPQRELIRHWIDAGAPRGTPQSRPGGPGTASGGGSPVRPGRRRSPALDVVLPTEVKLAPKALNATPGGLLEIVLPVGPLPAVTSLAFRGDGRLLAVGTHGRVVLWDLVEGQPVGALEGIPGSAHALTFSRDGRRLVLGAGLPARSGAVRIYSVPDGTLLDDFTGHDDVVFALAIRPDGVQLASASFDQTVRIWDLGRSRPLGVFRGHSDFVYAVAYTTDGRALLTAGKDRTIKRINARTLQEERTYSGHDQEVLTVAVHPDGTRFVSAGGEPQVRWWTLEGDVPVARRGGHSGPVHQLAFSDNGRRLISAGGDSSVRLWDALSGAPLRQLAGPADWQYAVAITDDGRLAAAGGWDGLVRLWDAESGKLRAILVQPRGSGSVADAAPRIGEWFAACPSGYVAGSVQLLAAARWRVGGTDLSAAAARTALVHPDRAARAMRGETVDPIALPKSP
jgi:hypothetical protein